METRSVGTTEDKLLAMIRREVARAVAEHQRAGILNNAAVTEGDLTVRGGGSLLVQDGGDVHVGDGGSVDVDGTGGINVTGGGDINVGDGGSLNVSGTGGVAVSGGGDVEVNDGGTIKVNDGGNVELRDRGQVKALHPNEEGAAILGRINVQGDGSYAGTGILVQQDDNTDIFSARDVVGGGSVVVVRDSNGDNVMFTSSGKAGLSAPLVHVPLAPWAFSDWPGTTSSTFTPVLAGYPRKYNPRIRVELSAVADSGTAGQARLMLAGVQVGSAFNVGTTLTMVPFEAELPGGIGSTSELRIEVRRTSGTGLVRATSYQCEGAASA